MQSYLVAEVMDMDEVNHNSQALNNGYWGEKIANIILPQKYKSVRQLDNLIDFYANNSILIEVKTCQEWINSGNPKFPFRMGRFTLEPEQHEHLLVFEGLYLFLVRSGNMLIKGKLIYAKNIKFMKQVTWSTLFT